MRTTKFLLSTRAGLLNCALIKGRHVQRWSANPSISPVAPKKGLRCGSSWFPSLGTKGWRTDTTKETHSACTHTLTICSPLYIFYSIILFRVSFFHSLVSRTKYVLVLMGWLSKIESEFQHLCAHAQSDGKRAAVFARLHTLHRGGIVSFALLCYVIHTSEWKTLLWPWGMDGRPCSVSLFFMHAWKREAFISGRVTEDGRFNNRAGWTKWTLRVSSVTLWNINKTAHSLYTPQLGVRCLFNGSHNGFYWWENGFSMLVGKLKKTLYSQ